MVMFHSYVSLPEGTVLGNSSIVYVVTSRREVTEMIVRLQGIIPTWPYDNSYLYSQVGELLQLSRIDVNCA